LPNLAIRDIVIFMRREYDIDVVVNKIKITKAIIDPHYEDKHSESINDEIILNLIKQLDGKSFEIEDRKSPFSYYVANKVKHNQKQYKLVWLLEDDQIYIGVVNAYRRS
jgi:hypothetical protein